MTPQEAVGIIETFKARAGRSDTGTTRVLLKKLGNPQKKLHFVHVAGSNGKGSTCVMLASVLQRAGYRTGLYTSPYIYEFGERLRINGENVPDEKLCTLLERVLPAAEQLPERPSQFELVTAMAMEYFASEHCDIVVLEVGLGGAQDATNVIDAPECAVLCNIGLEHTEVLGDTIAKIASVKAGIIKSGCDCVCYDGETDMKSVVSARCAELSVPLHTADFSALSLIDASPDGQSFTYRGEHFTISLLGPFQLRNAAVVIETVAALRGRGYTITQEQLREGLRAARWPVRLERFHAEPLILADGGHNPQCMEALAEGLRSVLPGQKVVFLCCVLSDKDYKTMLRTLVPLAKSFVCLTAPSSRALPKEELAACLAEMGQEAVTAEDMFSGLVTAIKTADGAPVVICGSLYMMEDARKALLPALKKVLRDRCKRARRAIPERERAQKNFALCEKIRESSLYRKARTILSYSAVGGEADLTQLHRWAAEDRKRVCFPLCVSRTEMIALLPEGESGWRRGMYDIPEPDPEHARQISPAELDLVICPCTGFDGENRRLGMGGGYYDRYLPQCQNAHIAAAAFEIQRLSAVPCEPWDEPMEAVFTEAQDETDSRR